MLAVGTILRNRYRILRVLGSGGFGDTYLAEDQDLPGHPACVVKQLRPKDRNPEVFRIAKNLFEREAEYLYRIGNAHPQIPNLFAHFTEGGEFYLVQEYIEGHSLAEEIPVGKRLTETEVVRLLLDILEVLAFVHQHNLIHRDIKLSNLLRRKKDGKIILIDFGAVKDVSGVQMTSQGVTNMTVSIGSPGYMPSEQAQGKPKLSSDVYAVGMIGIQALTGVPPAELPEDVNTGEILWQHLVRVSPEFQRILEKMTHYHFGQRYRSAIEALADLQAFAQSRSDLPTQMLEQQPPPSAPPTVHLPSPRGNTPAPPSAKMPLILGVTAAVLAVAGWGIWFVTNRPSSPTTSSSPTPIATIEPTPEPTVSPTPTETSSPSSPFIKVKIDELESYQHPKGIYSIKIPKGWKLTDNSQGGAVIHLWLDKAENALVGVQIFPDLGQEPTEFVEDFVKRAFGSNRNFQVSKPTSSAQGRWQVTWSYDETVMGFSATLRGDTYIAKYPDRLVLVTFASLADQFSDLEKSFNTVLESFVLNPSIPLP